MPPVPHHTEHTPQVGPAAGAPRRQADRLVVPDALRGLALLAMVIAHVDPFLRDPPRGWDFLSGQINDVASPLFALVMGMSAQIMLQRGGVGPRATWVVIGQNAVRGVVLIALGLWLETWGTWIAIVLAFLGVLLIQALSCCFWAPVPSPSSPSPSRWSAAHSWPGRRDPTRWSGRRWSWIASRSGWCWATATA